MTIVPTNSALQSFVFESVDVRIVNVDGDPWFVATDILAAMRSGTTLFAAKNMIEDDLGDGYLSKTLIVDSLGRNQEAVILHEAAVTLLISRSRTPMGKAFNRHLHSVILPTIRKTGKFVAYPESEDDFFEAKKRELKAARAELMALQILVIQSKVVKLKAQMELKPKPPETPDEMMEAIAAFCEGKSRISSTEILRHIEPQKIKRAQLRHNAVVSYLRPPGYVKNGSRHKVLINGASSQVYSWVN